jgi:hypothetical protein
MADSISFSSIPLETTPWKPQRLWRRLARIHTAQIVRDAIAAFPGGPPPRYREDREKLNDLVDDDVTEKWDELDSKFFKYQDPLEDLQIEYMKKNKDQINV